MAFQKLIVVKDEFRKLFSGVSIPYKGVNMPVPVKYAVLSAFDYTEEQEEIYPIITIYDKAIEKSEFWNPSGFKLLANQSNGIGTIYEEDAYLRFPFDVGVAAKSMLHITELEEYFFKNFIYDPYKLFLKAGSPGEEVGEPITLHVTPQKIPRPDGVHEINYDVWFDAWVQIKEPVDVELITSLVLDVQPK